MTKQKLTAPTPRPLKPTRVFVLRDFPMMEEPEEELATIIRSLELEGIEPEIVADELGPQELNNHRFDLLIIDYGGMATMGAWDTALANLRYTLTWAEDHPSVVVLVWTHFTAELAREIYDSFSDAPANMFIVSGNMDEQDKAWNLIRPLLGVEDWTI